MVGEERVSDEGKGLNFLLGMGEGLGVGKRDGGRILKCKGGVVGGESRVGVGKGGKR